MKIALVVQSLFALCIQAQSLPKEIPRSKACEAPVTLNASTNIWKEYKLHPNNVYRKHVEEAIPLINDTELKRKAEKVLDIGTFVWIEHPNEIPRIEETVDDVPCNQVLGLVLSGLPFKDCAGANDPPKAEPYSYQEHFIQPIVKTIKAHPNTAFALIVEPRALGNFVVHANSDKTELPNIDESLNCTHVATGYRKNVPLALKALDLPNVVLYLDIGHGGTLGWGVNFGDLRKKGTQEIHDTWEAAGELKQFRGVAVNTMGYNSWDAAPGESFKGENTCYDIRSNNQARNEQRYLAVLESELQSIKSKMPIHAIVDTSRSGVLGIRLYWGDWCNVNMAGFGQAPGMTSQDSRLDAFVWTKWGGISDGTSDEGSPNFKANCGTVTAHRPMPEKGQWSQSYFESLLRGWRQKNHMSKIESRSISERCG